MWDLFLSHATEDKAAVARPLARALRALGLTVWLDEDALELGDSLSEGIDRGLAESRFGLVILSQTFFSKHWTRRELDGLTTRQMGGEKVILPVWHNISAQEIQVFSPPLAGLVGVRTDVGHHEMARRIKAVVDRHRTSASPARSTLVRIGDLLDLSMSGERAVITREFDRARVQVHGGFALAIDVRLSSRMDPESWAPGIKAVEQALRRVQRAEDLLVRDGAKDALLLFAPGLPDRSVDDYVVLLRKVIRVDAPSADAPEIAIGVVPLDGRPLPELVAAAYEARRIATGSRPDATATELRTTSDPVTSQE